MTLKHFTIKTKLIAGFGMLSLIVVAVCALSLKALSDSTDGFSSFVHGINARADMVVQVRTHGWHVANHVDTHVMQMLRRTEPGEQEQLGGAVGAAGHDDVAACAGGAATVPAGAARLT